MTGLPRSGTSMLMQMLAEGGIPAYTDLPRVPDEDNPRGCLEREDATGLHRDASWIPEARGKAVKIVEHLLPHLPAGAELKDAELMRTYAGQLVRVEEWLRKRPGIAVLGVRYADAVNDPSATTAKMAAFLGDPFDRTAAAAAVDGRLRRQRAAEAVA